MTFTKNNQRILTKCEIPLLMFAVMAGPLLALTTNSSSPDPQLKETSFDGQPFSDVLFTEDVLLEVSARSRIDCSKKCVETEGCVMCTFLSSPQGPPGQCRLHSQLQNLTDAWQNKTGAKSMARIRRCDGGYVKSCGRCLKDVNQSVNYTTARQDCINMQGQLVMPRSQAEADCVWNFVKAKGLQTCWVGADDLKSPRVFKWNDGTLLPDNSPLWCKHSGDPDHHFAGNSSVVLVISHPHFYDRSCSDRYQYLCQKDLM